MAGKLATLPTIQGSSYCPNFSVDLRVSSASLLALAYSTAAQGIKQQPEQTLGC